MSTARNRSIPALALVAVALAIPASPTRAEPVAYSIDILSSEYYPQLRDSWMLRINNQGVAAGYIATESTSGPFLPATYAGGGQFQTFGIQAPRSQFIVTGISDRGDVVGNLTDTNFDRTPYIARDGSVEFLSLPPGTGFPFLHGINNAGLAYGMLFDDGDESSKVFTVSDGTVNLLPLAAPGLVHFSTSRSLLNDAGILGVFGSAEDFSSTTFLYDLSAATLTPLAVPDGFDQVTSLSKVTATLAFGGVATADFSQSRLGLWDLDGSFRSFFDPPEGTIDIRFNDLGQAIGLNDGQVLFYDGSDWRERPVLGLDGYTIATITDFNNRGDFVGLARNPAGNFLWGYRALAVPEPGSLALLACGLVALGLKVGYRRRRNLRVTT